MLAGRYSAGGLGGSAPSSVHAPGVKAPGEPPIATKRIPSGPGRIWRTWSGPTRTIVPGRSSNSLPSATSVAGTAERDVDLLLVRVERLGTVVVAWVAVPV